MFSPTCFWKAWNYIKIIFCLTCVRFVIFNTMPRNTFFFSILHCINAMRCVSSAIKYIYMIWIILWNCPSLPHSWSATKSHNYHGLDGNFFFWGGYKIFIINFPKWILRTELNIIFLKLRFDYETISQWSLWPRYSRVHVYSSTRCHSLCTFFHWHILPHRCHRLYA